MFFWIFFLPFETSGTTSSATMLYCIDCIVRYRNISYHPTSCHHIFMSSYHHVVILSHIEITSSHRQIFWDHLITHEIISLLTHCWTDSSFYCRCIFLNCNAVKFVVLTLVCWKEKDQTDFKGKVSPAGLMSWTTEVAKYTVSKYTAVRKILLFEDLV